MSDIAVNVDLADAADDLELRQITHVLFPCFVLLMAIHGVECRRVQAEKRRVREVETVGRCNRPIFCLYALAVNGTILP